MYQHNHLGFADSLGQIRVSQIDPNLPPTPSWIQSLTVPITNTNNFLGNSLPTSIVDQEHPSLAKESEPIFPQGQQFLINSRFGLPSFLSGIDEDSRGELDHLSTDSQGTLTFLSTTAFTENGLHCAVPESVRCLPGVDSLISETALLNDIRVVCAAENCNYNGPVHPNCLKRWNSYCEFHCRMLVTGPTQSTNIGSTLDNKSILEGLFKLYECPKCKQYTLCRSSSDSNFHTPNSFNSRDPYASVLSAIQFISHQLNLAIRTFNSSSSSSSGAGMSLPPPPPPSSSIGATTVTPAACLVQSTSPSLPQNLQVGLKTLIDMQHSSAAAPMFGTIDDSGFQLCPNNTKRSSWNSDWSEAHTSPLQSVLTGGQQGKTMRRFSLRRETSSTSIPSNPSSGFFSAYGTNESSMDSSRRSSNNTFGNILNETIRAEEMDHWAAKETNNALGQPRPLRGSRLASTPENVSTTDPPIKLESGSMNESVTGENALEPTNLRHQFSATDFASSHDTNPDDNRVLSDFNGRMVNRRHNSVSSSGVKPSGGLWSDGLKPRITQWQSSESTNQRKTVNCKGNIFKQRQDFDVFTKLPANKRNAYFIQMDDDSCTGNEDTRAFILAQLTNHRVSEVCCLICQKSLDVYDHFPVVDGIFFTSPVCHRAQQGPDKGGGLRVTWHTNGITSSSLNNRTGQIHSSSCDQISNKTAQKLLAPSKTVAPPPGCLGPRQQLSLGHMMDHQSGSGTGGGGGSAGGGNQSSRYTHSSRQGRYLHALCMNCMHLDNHVQDQLALGPGIIKCRTCSKPWSGQSLLVGGLYTYDVFAASPCCSTRLTCNQCHSRLDTLTTNDQNPSDRPASSSSSGPTSPTVDPTSLASLTISQYPLSFFSQYSHLIACPYCSKTDYHFVKPFEDVYQVEIGPKVE